VASLLYSDVVEISEEDAAQSMLVDLDSLGFTGTSWQPFSQASLHVHLGAQFRADNSKIAVYLRDAFLLTNATGQALTVLAKSNYGLDRNLAAPTQLQLTITCNASSGPYTVDVGELTFTHTPTGQTYRNVLSATIGPASYPTTLGSNSSLTLLVEAEIGGSAANIAASSTAGVQVTLDTSLAGVTVTSYSLQTAGVDEESDDRLRQRCQLQMARNQPRLASIYDGVVASALEAAPAVVNVSVDDSNPRGPGTFDVYIADLDTTSSDADQNQVQQALDFQHFGRNAIPKTVQVYRATEVPLDISGVIYYTGVDQATVQTAVEAALVAFVRATPPGGWSFFPGATNVVAKNDLESVIRAAVQSVASSRTTVVLSTPLGDTTVAKYGKVVRGTWSLGYQLISS
jgi:uncharacterized phage protein gp47/JayE